jgi:hypothetical protein
MTTMERRENLNGDQIGSCPKSPAKKLIIMAHERGVFIEALGGERWTIFHVNEGKGFHGRATLARNLSTNEAFDFLRALP